MKENRSTEHINENPNILKLLEREMNRSTELIGGLDTFKANLQYAQTYDHNLSI